MLGNAKDNILQILVNQEKILKNPFLKGQTVDKTEKHFKSPLKTMFCQ